MKDSDDVVDDSDRTVAALLSADGGQGADTAVTTIDSTQASETALKPLLELPHIPSRPSSPGTLSNLSTSEWQSLQDQAKAGHHGEKSSWLQRAKAFKTRNLGVFYMLVANFFGCAMNVTVRLLEIEGNQGKGFHPFQVLFARMAITVLCANAYMAYAKTPYFPFGMPEIRWLLIARGIGGFFGVFGMYFSLQVLPISDATVITFLAPGLSCWACSFIIKEPFTRIEKIGTLVSLVGVIFIARPATLFASLSPGSGNATSATGTPDMPMSNNGTKPAHGATDFDSVTPSQRVAAVGVALIGVLGAVSAYTTIRWIGKRAHPLISVNYLSVWSTLVSLVMQFALPGVGFLLPSDLKDWGLLILLGICGFIMQFLLAAALSYEKSSRATNMIYTSMLFALASDKIFFDTSPGVSSITGSVLIMGAAIVMAIQKGKTATEPKPVEAADEEQGLMRDMEGGEHDADQDFAMHEVRGTRG